jgi:hypothetical protein
MLKFEEGVIHIALLMQKLAARSEILKDFDQAFVNLVGALNARFPFLSKCSNSCRLLLQKGRLNDWISPLELQLCRYGALAFAPLPFLAECSNRRQIFAAERSTQRMDIFSRFASMSLWCFSNCKWSDWKGVNPYTGASCKANRVAEKKRPKEASISKQKSGRLE